MIYRVFVRAIRSSCLCVPQESKDQGQDCYKRVCGRHVLAGSPGPEPLKPETYPQLQVTLGREAISHVTTESAVNLCSAGIPEQCRAGHGSPSALTVQQFT